MNIERYWKESFDKSALKYKEDHQIAQWSEHGLHVRISVFKNYIHSNKNLWSTGKFLDAGCGSGIYSRLLKDRSLNVISADYSFNMIKLARAREISDGKMGGDFLVSDLNFLPFSSGLFSGIICIGVFQHLHDYRKVLNEFYEALINGGEVLVIAPNKKFIVKKTVDRYNWYNLTTVIEYAYSVGYKDYEYSYVYIMPKYFQWLENILNGKLLNKLFSRFAHDFLVVLKK